MTRPIYPHELTDPDFSWLISNFLERQPNYCLVENGCLPIVLVQCATAQTVTESEPSSEIEQLQSSAVNERTK